MENNITNHPVTPTPAAGPIPVSTAINIQSDEKAEKIRMALAERIRRAANGENPDSEETIFTLRYKKGPVTNNVNFWCENNLDKAQLKARAFCDRFRFRFIWVEPFCIDIEAKPDYLTPEQAEKDKEPVYK